MNANPRSIRMPDFTRVSRMYRHSVWSATASLARLGVPLDRIVIQYAGGGWPAGSVIAQSPGAGVPVTPTARVLLRIAGSGTHECLPYPLREDSAGEQMAADKVGAVLDVPISRTRVLVHEGASHFRLSADAPLTALRWIRDVMRASSAPWTRNELYRVARLFSALHRIAGREDAIATALGFVFDLAVQRLEVRYHRHPMDSSLGTRLGEWNGRLGIDTVVGDGLIAPYALRVRIGYVSLDAYLRHLALEEGRRAIYSLLLPVSLPGGVEERWVVEPRRGGYRLGAKEAPSMLGVSSYLSEAAQEPFSG